MIILLFNSPFSTKFIICSSMALTRRNLLKSLPFLASSGQFARSRDPQIKLRFAVASDGHFGQPGTEYEKFHQDLIGWLNLEKIQKGLDFTILNGDLIHNDPTLYYDLKNTLKRFSMPYYATRGNHDMVGRDVWQSTFGYPTNHSFSKDEYAFILVDTSNEKGEYVCPDAVWLEQELAKHSAKKGVFVFMHITPAKWTTHGIDCPDIRGLLEKTPNVNAIFHGHDHDQDGVKSSGGKPYLFDGHFGGSWGTHYKGYRIVEINYDNSWTTYQYNPAAEPILNKYQKKS